MESLSDILKKLSSARFSGSGGATDLSTEAEAAPDCGLCGGMEWVKVEVPLRHEEFGRLRPCPSCRGSELETDQEHQSLRVRASNLTAVERFTFESLDLEGWSTDPDTRKCFLEAYQAARDFADAPSSWLVLTGPSACGKTHLAAAIAQHVLASGCAVYFITAPDLLDHLRSAFSPSSELPYDELFERVRNVPLLVLDDLGAHAATPWAQEKLLQILNHRYNRELPTVIALGIPLEELEERLRTRLTAPGLSRQLPLASQRISNEDHIGIPPDAMLLEMTFKSFNVRGSGADTTQQYTLKSALQQATTFAEAPEGQWLVFVGHTGVGKTHLAIAIYNLRLQQNKNAMFTRVPDLMDHLRSTFAPDSPVRYDEIFERVKEAPLLVLDDLGTQSSTAWAEEKLHQLIVHRHDARLPTVITVNPRVRLTDAVGSRLADVRFVSTVELDVPDYRNAAISRPRQVQGERQRRG